MLYLQEGHYRELACEIRCVKEGATSDFCSAVEMAFGEFEIIFGFDYGDSLDRWILICFENGLRCGSDFDVEKLRECLKSDVTF